jgi:hypothetical protein
LKRFSFTAATGNPKRKSEAFEYTSTTEISEILMTTESPVEELETTEVVTTTGVPEKPFNCTAVNMTTCCSDILCRIVNPNLPPCPADPNCDEYCQSEKTIALLGKQLNKFQELSQKSEKKNLKTSEILAKLLEKYPSTAPSLIDEITTPKTLRNLTYHLIIDSGASSNITLNGTVLDTPEQMLSSFNDNQQRNSTTADAKHVIESFIGRLVKDIKEKDPQMEQEANALKSDKISEPMVKLSEKTDGKTKKDELKTVQSHYSPMSSGDDNAIILY